MALTCIAPQPDAPLVSALVEYVDCQSQALGAAGFQALATPGSSVALALGGLLTIFVALIGYRMLLGEVPGLRQAVLWMVRIGLVLTLASAWPAYSVLVYRVATLGPIQLAAEIGRPMDLPGSNGSLVDRIQTVSDDLDRVRTDKPSLPGVPGQPPQQQAAQQPQQGQQAQNGQAPPTNAQVAAQLAAFDPASFVMPAVRLIFLVSALGALLAVRVVTGLLLALGPLFFAFLLFDATRGLFEGWVRGIAGAALAMLATLVTLGIELSVVEPLLDYVLASQNGGVPVSEAPEGLLVVVLLFGIALAAALFVAIRIAAGFRLPWPQPTTSMLTPALAGAGEARFANAGARSPLAPAAEPRSRAAAVADAVAASERREAGSAVAASVAGDRRAAPLGAERAPTPDIAPLGQSYRRPTRQRVSASVSRRDSRA